MFHDFQQKISETRQSIRRSVHQNHIYDNCTAALKNEKSVFKKAETKLKKFDYGVQFGDNIPLRLLFEKILGTSKQSGEKKRRELLYTKLNQMAGSRVIEYLSTRVSQQAASIANIKALEKEENKLKKGLEKLISKQDHSMVQSLIPFTFKIENLKSDLIETTAALNLGEKAQIELINLGKNLKQADNWGYTTNPHDYIPNQQTIPNDHIFSHAVNAHMLLCAFKNELREFSENRDLTLHLASIANFKNSFFNNLIVDWVEEGKIKLSLFYVRKTQNSLEAIIQGLKSKTIKIESELSITLKEQQAILNNTEM